MKKALFLMGHLSVAGFALATPVLNEDNVEALTSALGEQGYTVNEIAIDGDHYEVVGKRDSQEVVILVSETYEIIEVMDKE